MFRGQRETDGYSFGPEWAVRVGNTALRLHPVDPQFSIGTDDDDTVGIPRQSLSTKFLSQPDSEHSSRYSSLTRPLPQGLDPSPELQSDQAKDMPHFHSPPWREVLSWRVGSGNRGTRSSFLALLPARLYNFPSPTSPVLQIL